MTTSRLIALCLLAAGAGCGVKTTQPATTRGPDSPQAARGRAVYAAACAPCHGPEGNGKGPIAGYLATRPRDFTCGEFKFRSTESGQLPLDSDLARTIAEGIPGTAMPSWKHKLPRADIDAVAAFVKSYSPRFAEAKRAPRQVAPPAIAADRFDPAEGRALYLLFKCWECHGLRGRGDGPAERELKDDLDRPIRATNFHRGVFRGGGAQDDLFRTLATGLNGTPMPAFRDALLVSREALSDLTALEPHVDVRTIADLRTYIDTLPTEAQIDAMDDAAQQRVIDHRVWQIVGYVLSLAEGKGVTDYLFWDGAGRIPPS